MPEQDLNKDAPKLTSTGMVKNPETGSTATAKESNPAVEQTPAQKAMNEAKAKLSATNPNTNAAKAPASTTATQTSTAPKTKSANVNPLMAPVSKEVSVLKGEILQGDSFRITMIRDGIILHIPVTLETSRDLYTLDNTFTLIEEILATGTKGELQEKFASFLPEGV